MPVSIFRGDNKTLRVSITDKARVPVDTTGWTIEFTLRQDDDDPGFLVYKTSAIPGQIDPVTITSGIWDISLLPADTDQCPGVFVFDVQGTTPAFEIYTVLKDEVIILQDVTRA